MLKSPLFWKITTLIGCIVLLSLPLMMVRELINERADYRSEVVDAIEQSTSGSQKLAGPLIAIPITETLTRMENQKEVNYQRSWVYYWLPESLAALAQKYALFVVSNSQDGYVQAFLHWSGLTCFRDIEMAGRTGLDKGANIRLVMERNGVTKAVYVGDTQGDADAAAKAGIPFIFTEYGFGSVKDAAARIASLPELPAAVEKIFAEQ